MKQWQKVSDTTGRGFGEVTRKVPGCEANYNDGLPRPTMKTITTQNPKSLDHDNRFFEDSKRRMNEMLALGVAQEEPEVAA